jgi:predicted DCC family thiol-disulfide oxidoreductase YuxK
MQKRGQRISENLAVPHPLVLVDITKPEYDPKSNNEISYEEAMKVMHVIRADGVVVKGVDAFSEMYHAVGLGWIFAILKVRPVRSAAESFYSVWAKYRLQITGRPATEMNRIDSGNCDACKNKM